MNSRKQPETYLETAHDVRKPVAPRPIHVPAAGQGRVLYLGFSRLGWSEAAHTFAAEGGEWAAPAMANWQPIGLKLLDLAQVDSDLYSWVHEG